MDLDEAIRQCSAILPEHQEQFIKDLKSFPDHIDKWLYATSTIDAEELYQGDIVLNLSTYHINDENSLMMGTEHVALMSNSCDMQAGREKFIVFSPIVSIEEIKRALLTFKSSDDVENIIRDIRKNRVFAKFYLPCNHPIPESFIDFSRMMAITSSNLNKLKKTDPERFPISLSPSGLYLFLIKITYHFARAEKTK